MTTLLERMALKMTSQGEFIMTENNAIVKKIQKLLALADSKRNDSDAEAQAALLKAQQLMAEHGV